MLWFNAFIPMPERSISTQLAVQKSKTEETGKRKVRQYGESGEEAKARRIGVSYICECPSSRGFVRSET